MNRQPHAGLRSTVVGVFVLPVLVLGAVFLTDVGREIGGRLRTTLQTEDCHVASGQTSGVGPRGMTTNGPQRLCASAGTAPSSSAGCPLRICPAYRHTGNYWLYSDQPLPATDVAALLSEAVARGFAVFTVEEFLDWLARLKAGLKEPSQIAAGRRATPGGCRGDIS